jgi:WD40 repeat protein
MPELMLGYLRKKIHIAVKLLYKRIVLVVDPITVRLWNVKKKRQKTVLHTSDVTRLVITTDDKYIVSGSRDKTVRLWNVKKKRVRSYFNRFKNC